MTSSLPTRGQLERALEQRIRALYREQLGQRLEKFTCQFFDEKATIVLEGATLLPEQLLLSNGRGELASELRIILDKILRPQLRSLIADIVGVGVIDALVTSNLETGYSSITVVLAGPPLVRDLETIPKATVRDEPGNDPQSS